MQRFDLLRGGFEQAFACRSVECEALKGYGSGYSLVEQLAIKDARQRRRSRRFSRSSRRETDARFGRGGMATASAAGGPIGRVVESQRGGLRAGLPGAIPFLTVTHPGRRHLGQLPPQVITQIKPGQSLYACQFTLISYQASIRKAGVPAVFVMNDQEVWDEETSTLCLRDAQHECAWSFDGERMDLAVSSPTLAVNLKIQGGSQVMWADDRPRK